MENKKDIIEINLVYIFGKIWNRKFLILFTGIFFALSSFVYVKFLKTPIYESTTKIYAVNSYNSNNVTIQDLQISGTLLRDYQQIILSNDVLSGVIKDEKLLISTGALAEKIKITSPKDTHIIEITVSDADPKIASDVANATRERAVEKIKDITKVKDITVLEEAKPNLSAINLEISKVVSIAFFAGISLVIFLIVLREIIDDRVKRPEDLEENMDLVVLGVIPKIKRGE